MTKAIVTKPITPGIIGQRFGLLQVIAHVSDAEARSEGRTKGYWLAKCDCGNEVRNKNVGQFTSGRAFSCGCTKRRPLGIGLGIKKPRQSRRLSAEEKARRKAERAARPQVAKINLTGQRYGILTAVSFLRHTVQGAEWLCRCDCGKESTARAKDLRNGNTASCGCLKAGNWAGKPTLDINRPWRPDEQVDDRWLVLLGQNAPPGAGSNS